MQRTASASIRESRESLSTTREMVWSSQSAHPKAATLAWRPGWVSGACTSSLITRTSYRAANVAITPLDANPHAPERIGQSLLPMFREHRYRQKDASSS